MLTAEARVQTDRPRRYLVQLCSHFSNKGRHVRDGHRPRSHGGGGGQSSAEMRAMSQIRPDQIDVEWSDTYGTVSLPWGRCVMEAEQGALTLRAEAHDEENLQQIQDLVTGHLERFSRRNPLTVTWERKGEPAVQPGESLPAAPAHTAGPTARRWHRGTILLVALGVLAVAVHLGLGGAVLSDSRWTDWGVNIILAIVVLKVIVILVKVTSFRRLAARRRRRPANQP
ncbi:DUF2218 domain-containing protein [Streptomyces canus]|uniref:DUF2218 domain-containing protein n=1 Tax=Streptomyces canus TaxID=58343 RepID=UPI003805C2A6